MLGRVGASYSCSAAVGEGGRKGGFAPVEPRPKGPRVGCFVLGTRDLASAVGCGGLGLSSSREAFATRARAGSRDGLSTPRPVLVKPVPAVSVSLSRGPSSARAGSRRGLRAPRPLRLRSRRPSCAGASVLVVWGRAGRRRELRRRELAGRGGGESSPGTGAADLDGGLHFWMSDGGRREERRRREGRATRGFV